MKNLYLVTVLTIIGLLSGCDSSNPKAEIVPQKQTLSFSDEKESETLVLRNDGDAPGNWSVSSSPSWLSATPAQGSLKPGESISITFVANLNQDKGSYTDGISIISEGTEYSVQASLNIRYTVNIFPGIGAGGITLDDAYGKVKSHYGTLQFQRVLYIQGRGFFHLLSYEDDGISFFFHTSDGNLTDNASLLLIEIDSPYDGVTSERIGIGSTIAALKEKYGEPESIDTQTRRYNYSSLGMNPKYDLTETAIESIVLIPSESASKSVSVNHSTIHMLNSRPGNWERKLLP